LVEESCGSPFTDRQYVGWSYEIEYEAHKRARDKSDGDCQKEIPLPEGNSNEENHWEDHNQAQGRKSTGIHLTRTDGTSPEAPQHAKQYQADTSCGECVFSSTCNNACNFCGSFFPSISLR